MFSTLNDLIAQGVITDYALGGSVAFMFYCQPFLTNDTDFFVQMPGSGLLVSLSPIYAYAAEHNFPLDHEHIVVDDEPVQIIPAPSPLYDEAIATAQQRTIEGQNVKVMLPEYLVCTALNAGRMKDFAKIEKLLEEAEVDLSKLKELITRFQLSAQWKRYLVAIGVTDPAFLHLAETKATWRRAQADKRMEDKLQEIKKLRTRVSAIRYRNALYRPV
ncbi:MAG: hypothetical protein WC505_07000 [Patescibacteria group bacterium]